MIAPVPSRIEALGCPYCPTRFTLRENFRRHVVLNRCGSVPEEASCSLMVTEKKLILEAEFQRLVMAKAEDEGWLTCHIRRSLMSDGRMLTATSSSGYPDLTLVRPPAVVFLELKAERGHSSPEQRKWIRQIQKCEGVEAWIVKPSDWREIVALLTSQP